MPQVDVEVSGGTGTFAADLLDPAGNPPANVIQSSDPGLVRCTWSVNGLISLFSGTWRVQVLLEGLGAQAPEDERNATLQMNAGQTTPYQLDIPLGAIQLPATEDSFSFKVAAVLTARTSGFPLPVAAIADLGVVQIYRFP